MAARTYASLPVETRRRVVERYGRIEAAVTYRIVIGLFDAKAKRAQKSARSLARYITGEDYHER